MSNANKRLVEYHIGRLKDKNPSARLAAIEELRKLNDIDALDPLQEVYKNDEDIDVRKAAQEAGRAIYVANASK